jgi:hypothetical protein
MINLKNSKMSNIGTSRRMAEKILGDMGEIEKDNRKMLQEKKAYEDWKRQQKAAGK